MSNYTITNLRSDIESINLVMLDSGSNVFFREQGRNGYQAVDLMYVDEKGEINCHTNIESGSSKECFLRLNREYKCYFGKTFHGSKITRKTAKTLLKNVINFNNDFHQCPLSSRGLLVKFAKLTKYRRPQTATGSLALYFFNHLQNKVTTN